MIGTRYITKDRKPLQTILPLESPLVLFVDPSDACCLACNFCPTGDSKLMNQVGRPLHQMDMNLFKKIVDDLDRFKTPIKVLRLYTHGEPLLNKNFCDMVSYAKKSSKIESIDTTTNGVLLNKELNLRLIDSGIDRINISVNGLSDKQYESFTNRKINFRKYIDNIKHLYQNKKDMYLFIKVCGDILSEEEQKQFLRIFEPIADSVGIEHTANCWNDFELKGNIKPNDEVDIYGEKLKDELTVCPYTQYSLSIGSTGEVSLCFLDWNRKLIIGNVNTESVYAIWNSEKLNSFQNMMLKGERSSHSYCKKCNQLRIGNPSNIDMYAKEILERKQK